MNESFFKGKRNIFVCAIICTALWGSAFPAIKIGYKYFGIEGDDTFSKILFAGIRFTISAVLVLLFSTLKNHKIPVPKKESIPFIGILGTIYTTLQYLCFYIGLSFTSGSKASIIDGSIVFFSVILAHIFFKDDKLTAKKIFGCIVGFVGIVIINLTGSHNINFSFSGEGMLLLSAVAMAVGSVLIKKNNSCEPPETITGYQMLFGAVILVATGIIGGGHLSLISLNGIILLTYMTLLSAVAFTVWNFLLVYNPVGQIAVFNFLTPVFGTILSAICLGDHIFTLKNMAALIFVSAGIIIVNYSKIHK